MFKEEQENKDEYVEYLGKTKEDLESLRRIYLERIKNEREFSIQNTLKKKLNFDIERFYYKFGIHLMLIGFIILFISMGFFAINSFFNWIDFNKNQFLFIIPFVLGIFIILIFGTIAEIMKPTKSEILLRRVEIVLRNKFGGFVDSNEEI